MCQMIESIASKVFTKCSIITTLFTEQEGSLVRRKREEKNTRVLFSEKSAVCLIRSNLLEYRRQEKIRKEEDAKNKSTLANERDCRWKLKKDLKVKIKLGRKQVENHGLRRKKKGEIKFVHGEENLDAEVRKGLCDIEKDCGYGLWQR